MLDLARTSSGADTLAKLEAARFVPVVRASSPEKALAAARALAAGGCRAVEVAMTVPDAAWVIGQLVAEGVFVGAGTVLTAAMAREVAAAGARYLIGPTTEPDVLAFGRQAGLVVVAGALTPNEVLAAHRAGADLIKVFPASSLGGPQYLKLLKDPFPQLRVFASGGVTLELAPDYLAAGAVALGIGGALVNQARIEAGNFAWLEAEARRWADSLYQE